MKFKATTFFFGLIVLILPFLGLTYEYERVILGSLGIIIMFISATLLVFRRGNRDIKRHTQKSLFQYERSNQTIQEIPNVSEEQLNQTEQNENTQ